MTVFVSILFYMMIAAVTIVCAYQVRKGTVFQKHVYLAAIISILFVCSALRYGIGNDYVNYVQTAHEAYVDGYVVTEVGFNGLVKLLYTLFGGEYYELLFACFAIITIVIFVKAMYQQSVDFSFSFFIFMTVGLYFQSYNTVRYYLALAIALYSMRYVLNRDIIRFVFWILIGVLFHKSVLLVIPVYWVAAYEWKKWQIVTGILLSALCYISRPLVLKLALLLYPSYENTVYLKGGTSYVSIIRGIGVLVLYLWIVQRYPKEQAVYGRELRFYAQLNLLSVIVYVFFSFLPVVTRIAYYFMVSQVLMIPQMTAVIPEQEKKKKITLFIMIICVIYFVVFLLDADKPGVALLPYRSWLFEEERLIFR